MLNIFIGYDTRETIAWSVLAQSIIQRATVPVSITPIMLSQLDDIFSRDRNELQSTDFSFSRFLTPFLSDYKGWSLFLDCDMLVLEDITTLFDYVDEEYAVMCVKHNHVPEETVKFLGAKQTKYEKKNWSSVMLMNNEKCKALTPEYVSTASGLDLHQFKWLEDDTLIGSLPPEWNHLVGYDDPNAIVNLVHYTIGGPYFEEYEDTDYADEWYEELKSMFPKDLLPKDDEE